MKTKFYIVVDNDNYIWERAFDFKESQDYFYRDINLITKANILTLKQANKLKTELDKEIASVNNKMACPDNGFSVRLAILELMVMWSP